MKKIFLQFVAFLMLCISASAQIPNPSFENWTGNEPDEWTTTNNVTFPNSVTSTTPAYEGSQAAKLEALNASGFPYISLLSTTYADASKPAALHGWYKFTPSGSATVIITIGAMFNSGTVGGGGASINSATSVFQEFVANMLYVGSDVDSLVISFTTAASPVGTIFIVDDLKWGAASSSAVSELNKNELSLEGALQNPSSGVTDIIYDLPVASNVSLKIFDLNGKELRVLVNEKQSAGRFKAQFNSNELASGIYFCILNAGGAIRTSKLIVAN